MDDLPAVLAATNHTFAKWGVPPLTMDRFRAEFSLPFKDFYLRFLPGIPVTELEPVFHGHFTTANVPVEEIPHAREFLKFCRDHGLRTFVLSTVHPAYYAKQTAANGFDKYIDRAYLAVWDKRRKIAQLLSENNLAAEETLFIGDMQHDIETARHGGVFSCGVLTGYNRLEICDNTAGDWDRNLASTTVVNDGNFHEVTVVREGPNLYLYIDGVLENATSTPGAININNAANVYLGYDRCTGEDGTYHFQGVLDNIIFATPCY